jgi:hypothetical protein
MTEHSLAQNGQAEAGAKREWQRGHFLKCGMQLGVAAGLDRDHERQRALIEARLLQHSVNVELVSREDRRQTRNDARLIFHH